MTHLHRAGKIHKLHQVCCVSSLCVSFRGFDPRFALMIILQKNLVVGKLDNPFFSQMEFRERGLELALS